MGMVSTSLGMPKVLSQLLDNGAPTAYANKGTGCGTAQPATDLLAVSEPEFAHAAAKRCACKPHFNCIAQEAKDYGFVIMRSYEAASAPVQL